MRFGPFHMKFTVKRPTLRDRLWFVWDHRRGTPLRVLWALARGRGTGIHITREHGSGTVYLNEGYAASRRPTVFTDCWFYDKNGREVTLPASDPTEKKP